jgi:hypothetical protein
MWENKSEQRRYAIHTMAHLVQTDLLAASHPKPNWKGWSMAQVVNHLPRKYKA